MTYATINRPLWVFKNWFKKTGHVYERSAAIRMWLEKRIKGLPNPPAGITAEAVMSFMGWDKPLTFTKVPAGVWVEATPIFPVANKGKIEAMIYPPSGESAEYKLCYGNCTGDAAHLRGKVMPFQTNEAAEHFIRQQTMHW